MTSAPLERWDAGDAYEQFMGVWSRTVALRFLEWLELAPGQRWLDVGCGTGALSNAIATQMQPQIVGGLDPSQGFIRYALRQTPAALFIAGTGSDLPLAAHAVDVTVSGLALNFIPEPRRALREMQRVTRAGGMVAAYVWDYAGKMEFLRYFWDAAAALDESAAALHEGARFPLCLPEPLRDLWQSEGFDDIAVEALEIPVRFASFDEYWRLFLVGDFPAPHYAASLNDDQREALRARLQASIPARADGYVYLIARAWGIRGMVRVN